MFVLVGQNEISFKEDDIIEGIEQTDPGKHFLSRRTSMP